MSRQPPTHGIKGHLSKVISEELHEEEQLWWLEWEWKDRYLLHLLAHSSNSPNSQVWASLTGGVGEVPRTSSPTQARQQEAGRKQLGPAFDLGYWHFINGNLTCYAMTRALEMPRVSGYPVWITLSSLIHVCDAS